MERRDSFLSSNFLKIWNFLSHLNFRSSVVHIRLIAFLPEAMPPIFQPSCLSSINIGTFLWLTVITVLRTLTKLSNRWILCLRTNLISDRWTKISPWRPDECFKISIDRLVKTSQDNTVLLLPQKPFFHFPWNQTDIFSTCKWLYFCQNAVLLDLRTHIEPSRRSPRYRNPGVIYASSNKFLSMFNSKSLVRIYNLYACIGVEPITQVKIGSILKFISPSALNWPITGQIGSSNLSLN